jgi:hypothetical protein
MSDKAKKATLRLRTAEGSLTIAAQGVINLHGIKPGRHVASYDFDQDLVQFNYEGAEEDGEDPKEEDGEDPKIPKTTARGRVVSSCADALSARTVSTFTSLAVVTWSCIGFVPACRVARASSVTAVAECRRTDHDALSAAIAYRKTPSLSSLQTPSNPGEIVLR